MNRKKASKRSLYVLIDESLHDQLLKMIEKTGETKSDFVRRALEREVERRKQEELENAAAELAFLYETDEELVVFE